MLHTPTDIAWWDKGSGAHADFTCFKSQHVRLFQLKNYISYFLRLRTVMTKGYTHSTVATVEANYLLFYHFVVLFFA